MNDKVQKQPKEQKVPEEQKTLKEETMTAKEARARGIAIPDVADNAPIKTGPVPNIRNPEPKVPGLKLNIGSGIDYVKGWINVDKFDASADANWDIGALPLHDNSVAAIMAHEVLEHLSYHEIDAIVKEWHRVLKVDGMIFALFPEITDLLERMLKSPDDPMLHARLYGSQFNDGQFHKQAFTVKRIHQIFSFAGYRTIGIAHVQNGDNRDFYIEVTK